MKHVVKINKKSGELTWLTPPPFHVPTENMRWQRYSEIVPVSLLPRLLFRLLRAVFGETGKVAAFTRQWAVLWRGTILIGQHKGETKVSGIRQSIIDWEHEVWFGAKFDL